MLNRLSVAKSYSRTWLNLQYARFDLDEAFRKLQAHSLLQEQIMATRNEIPTPDVTEISEGRHWDEQVYRIFARVVAKKHDVALNDVDLATLSDDELTKRIEILRELGHLPPK